MKVLFSLALCLLASSMHAATSPNFNVGYFNRTKSDTTTAAAAETQPITTPAPTPTPPLPPPDSPAVTPKSPDTALRENVEDALRNSWTEKNYKNIRIQIKNGVITLSGFIDNEDQHTDILDRINKFTPRSIDDRLTIHSPT